MGSDLGWGRGGGGVDLGLKLGRSNNAVKAFLNIVNIPKPAADEAISAEPLRPTPTPTPTTTP